MKGCDLRLRHVVIDPDPPGADHDITLLADLAGNGRPDVIIGGKVGPVNLFWYENPGPPWEGPWARHDMAAAPNLEAGGVVVDITGNGRPDVVAGQQTGGRELCWFECPPDPAGAWTRRIIEDRFEQHHDQAVGDVDGDGAPELVFLSQRAGILAYYDLPPDPTVEPWPRECFHVVAEDMHTVEGLVVVDVDGDGRNEIVAGTTVFSRGARAGDAWRAQHYLEGYMKTRVAVGDLTGDGRADIVVCEGESDAGRLAWCAAPAWTPTLLRDELFHPHSLGLADFTGDGRLDIFVAEMGLGKNADPLMMVYLNEGGGRFRETLIQQGIPTHEAKVADVTGNGRPDIVGKAYHPERHIDLWLNET